MMTRRMIAMALVISSTFALGIGGWLSSNQAAWAHETAAPGIGALGAIMPRLSPDGTTIAVSYQGALWKIPRGGGVMTRLTKGDGFDIEPAWSPDGRRIAYINSRGFGPGTLAVIEAESGRRVPLPREVQVMDKLHFDRDGQRILGVFQPPNEKMRLAWYDLANGELQSAIEDKSWPGYPLGTPGLMRQRVALSHDNQWLAVVSVADAPDEQTGNNGPQNELWRVPLSGGEPRRIITWPARIHDVCWRADDRALVIATERGGVHNDLWEVALHEPEHTARKLTFGQADEDSPSFSADNRWLAYTDNRHGPTRLVVRENASGHEEVVIPRQLDFVSPAGRIHLHLVEAADNSAATARVVLRHADGKFHAPPGSLYRVLGADLHFYADGGAAFDLPSGDYTLQVAHGPEYRVFQRTLTIEEGKEAEITAPLQRWTDQRRDYWISGENHIHANYGYGHWYNSPPTMRSQCGGEDLTVANFMVANSDGDGVFDREFFLGRPDPLSTQRTILYWNEEFRATIWGHMTLLNLKHLVTPIYTGFAHTSHPHDVPTNADIADHTHDQEGLVNYTHPAHSLQDPYAGAYSAKEMPVDVALGKVDSMDVMGSNHQANLPIWYRLLNCGLRIPASAGTDCFLNRITSRLPGSDRVYVHCAENFSYETWIANLRAGRTFVTNGPMLRLTVDDQEPGVTVRRQQPGELRVRGTATSQYPLDTLEIVVQGKVVKTIGAEGDRLRIDVDVPVMIDRSGWLALRARGPRAPEQPRVELFAHTSPVYLDVAGHPIRAPEDAEYFVEWIERLWRDVRQRNRIPARQQKHVEEQISTALDFYRGLMEKASR